MSKPKITAYLNTEIDVAARKLAEVREQTLSSLVETILEKEIKVAISTGELNINL